MSEPFGETAIINAMIDYTSPEAGTRHASSVMAELEERIVNAPRSMLILKTLLGSPRHIPLMFLERYLDHVGHDLLNEFRDIGQNPVSPLEHVDFDGFAPEELLRLLDICTANEPRSIGPLPRGRLMKVAMEVGIPPLLDRAISLNLRENETVPELIMRTAGFEHATLSSAKMLEDFLAQAELNSEPWTNAIAALIRKDRAKSVALVIAAGWNPVRVLPENCEPNRTGRCLARLSYRLSESNHAAIKFLSQFPSISEILAMDRKALDRAIGGPDKDEQALAEKKEKVKASVKVLKTGVSPCPKDYRPLGKKCNLICDQHDESLPPQVSEN